MNRETSISGALPWQEGDEKEVLKRTKAFYESEILKLNPVKDTLGDINYPVWGAVTLSWIIVYLCIKKGVEQTGKVALVTVLSPYALLTIFFLRVAFLDGFSLGMKYLFYPDFSKLFTFQIWKDALVQVAFQLSIGQGIMTTFASFRRPSDKWIVAGKW